MNLINGEINSLFTAAAAFPYGSSLPVTWLNTYYVGLQSVGRRHLQRNVAQRAWRVASDPTRFPSGTNTGSPSRIPTSIPSAARDNS